MGKRLLSLTVAFLLLVSCMTAALSVTAADGEVVISDCDTLDGWVKTGGNRLELKPAGYGGNSAIGCNVDKGAFRTCTYTRPEAVDISGCEKLQWDMMFMSNNQPGMWEEIAANYANDLYLKVGSSTEDYRLYRLSNMTVAQHADNPLWYHFSITIGSFASEKGAFDLTAMKVFVFATTDGAPSASVSNGHIRFDNIKATVKQDVEPPVIPDFTDVNNCDTLTGWSASETELVLDTQKKLEGAASVGAFAAGGTLKKLALKLDAPVDGSDYAYLVCDMYFSNLDWLDKTAEMLFEIGSAGDADKDSLRYMKSKLKPMLEKSAVKGQDGWYRMWFPLNDPQSRVGDCNLEAVNYLRFYTVKPAEGTLDYDVRVDHIGFATANYAGGPPADKQDPVVPTPPGGDDPAPSQDCKAVNSCDAADGWAASETDLILDTENKTEGTASIGAAGKDGVLKALTLVMGEPVDATGYRYLECDMYFSNLEWLENCEGRMFEIGSAGEADKDSLRYMKGKLQSMLSDSAIEGSPGWYHMKFDLKNPQAKAGSFQPGQFNYIRFYSVNPVAATASYDMRIDNIMLTTENYGKTQPKEDPKNAKWFTDCDSRDGWKVTGEDLVLDKVNKTEGEASIGASATGGVLKQIAYTAPEAIDATGYRYLECDLYFSDLTWLENCDGKLFEIGSGGKEDKDTLRYMYSKLKAMLEKGAIKGRDGWYHMVFDLQDPQQKAGNPDLKALNYIRFYSVKPFGDTPTYEMRIDNVLLTNENYVYDGQTNYKTGDNAPFSALCGFAVAICLGVLLVACRKKDGELTVQ